MYLTRGADKVNRLINVNDKHHLIEGNTSMRKTVAKTESKIKDKNRGARKAEVLSYRVFTKLCTALTILSLIFIIAYVFVRGIPHLKPEIFELKFDATNQSMFPAIIGTLQLVIASILIAAPVGIFTGFYLVEYSKTGSKFVEIIRMVTQTLSGIPSIVYGLFGMLFYVFSLQWSYSLRAGILTVSIMILPLIIRATEEALLSVKNNIREGSFALGAGKLRTIFKVVLPIAMPGILSGIILAIGRIVGETAALVYTFGAATSIPTSLKDSGRTLAVHMYVLSSEGLHVDKAFATGTILIVIVLIINALSTFLAGKLVEEK